jgi:hypothetical protein
VEAAVRTGGSREARTRGKRLAEGQFCGVHRVAQHQVRAVAIERAVGFLHSRALSTSASTATTANDDDASICFSFRSPRKVRPPQLSRCQHTALANSRECMQVAPLVHPDPRRRIYLDSRSAQQASWPHVCCSASPRSIDHDRIAPVKAPLLTASVAPPLANCAGPDQHA